MFQWSWENLLWVPPQLQLLPNSWQLLREVKKPAYWIAAAAKEYLQQPFHSKLPQQLRRQLPSLTSPSCQSLPRFLRAPSQKSYLN